MQPVPAIFLSCCAYHGIHRPVVVEDNWRNRYRKIERQFSVSCGRSAILILNNSELPSEAAGTPIFCLHNLHGPFRQLQQKLLHPSLWYQYGTWDGNGMMGKGRGPLETDPEKDDSNKRKEEVFGHSLRLPTTSGIHYKKMSRI